jgi:hypothetical protein
MLEGGASLPRLRLPASRRLLATVERQDVGGMTRALPECVFQENGAVMFFEKIGKGFVGKFLERGHLVFGEKVENVPGLIVDLYALAGHFISVWK